MERSSEYEDLAVALAEARPVPRADFATELDELVAAGFPRPSRFGGRLTSIAARFRLPSPRRPLLAAGATALAAIVIATVIVASNESASRPVALNRPQPVDRPHADFSRPSPPTSGGSVPSSGPAGQGASAGVERSSESSSSTAGSALGELSNSNADYGFTSLSRATHRDIERSAEIALLADPADVAEDSSKVFSAVHDASGIVLHSTTTAGRNAGAHFDLLIPSARLGDALAAFSTIDEVSSRHEASADITAPTVALGEQLQDSRAKIDGLLSQLAAAETESESDAIEVELRSERRRAAQLRARLSKLHQRVDFSRVSLRIETDSASAEPNGAWGIGDAWGDAGHILGIAAGVTIVGLALLGPLTLICLLAWVARRAWLQRARARALA
ncbi:MAG TPA: DUF4349 domain-containing protein [Solirubrobacterales bacterium]|jgi:hypothetical protein